MKQNSQQIFMRARFQGGLSLIELMISITIGLLILASLSSLFINQSRTRVELDKSNRMIDNGRYALELLSANLRLAGFYDNYTPAISPPAVLYDPCDTAAITDSTKNLDILKLHVQGYNSAGAASTIASPPCSLTFTPGSNLTLKAGSDILVLRRASTAIAASAVSGTTYLQVSMCQTDAAVPPNNYQIATAPATFSSMHKKDCTSAADLRPFMVQTYFVSPNNIVGDGIPTLKQIDQYGNVTPLVEGIEYMQIEYGVNNAGDSSADSYTDCSACTLADWSNVVSVRINIVARNQELTSGWNDSKTYSLGESAGVYTPTGADLNFKRHAYTQLVRLVNPASRRETP